jgi:hypothetical protein
MVPVTVPAEIGIFFLKAKHQSVLPVGGIANISDKTHSKQKLGLLIPNF